MVRSDHKISGTNRKKSLTTKYFNGKIPIKYLLQASTKVSPAASSSKAPGNSAMASFFLGWAYPFGRACPGTQSMPSTFSSPKSKAIQHNSASIRLTDLVFFTWYFNGAPPAAAA